MNKEEVIEMAKEQGITCSGQFIDYAIKFNSTKLVKDFLAYWKSRPVGGGDLNTFLLQHYKDKLGE
jgi:hypothetical protein